MKNVILAIEFGEDLEDIIDFTVDFFEGKDSEVFVVHAYDSHSALIDYLPQKVDENLLNDYEEQLQDQAKSVRSIVAKFLKHDIKAHGFMKPVNDTVAKSILEFAAEKDATMIAVGTHHPNKVERFFLGSVAEQVVRQSDIPVMVIPRKS